MALKFTVHVVQSFIKGHRKSGVISIKHVVMGREFNGTEIHGDDRIRLSPDMTGIVVFYNQSN